MRKSSISNETLFPALIIFLLMIIGAYIYATPAVLEGNKGICLPSPNDWHLSRWLGTLLNALVLLLCVIGVHLLNKTHNFITETDKMLPALLFLMLPSNGWTDILLNSGSLLLGGMILCLVILIPTYRARNSTREYFIVATIGGVGTMFQYAFLLIPIWAILAGLVLKSLHIKEFATLLMGLVAPFWVATGLGIIPLDAYTLPTLSNLFDLYPSRNELFFTMINAGVTVVPALLIGLNNAVKLYAGNARRRSISNAISLAGLLAVGCLCLDITNIAAYLPILYLAAAVQYANMQSLWKLPRPQILMLVIGVIYVGMYVTGL